MDPPIDFTDSLWTDSVVGSVTISAVSPIVYVPATHALSIKNASTLTSGVVTTSSQQFAGKKEFTSVPECAVTATLPNELVNKGYVDTAFATGLHYQEAIKDFYDFSGVPPSPLVNGDRYIASVTGGGFTKDYIYTYVSSLSAWSETIPEEGFALYNQANTGTFANQEITYNGTAWVQIASVIAHQDLIGAGTLTHATIDSYLNQAVKTTSDTTFNTMTTSANATVSTDVRINHDAVVQGTYVTKEDNLIFAASYANDFNASVYTVSGVPIETPGGGAAVVGRRLNLVGTGKVVKYNTGNLSTIENTGTIRFYMNYAGNVTTIMYILSIGSPSEANQISLSYTPASRRFSLTLIRDNAGTQIATGNFTTSFIPIVGREYEICFCFDVTGAGTYNLFIDGVKQTTLTNTTPGTYTRGGTTSRFYLGSTGDSDQYVRGFSAYKTVLFTDSYTSDGYTMSPPIVNPSYPLRNVRDLSVIGCANVLGSVSAAGNIFYAASTCQFVAPFSQNINPAYCAPASEAVGTAVGATISGRRLSVAATQYVTFPVETLLNVTTKGSIRFFVEFVSVPPSSSSYFFLLGNSANSIQLSYVGSSHSWHIMAKDGSGVAIFTYPTGTLLSDFTPIAGVEYEICLCFDFATTGNVNLFIDGTKQTTLNTTPWARGSTVSSFYVGYSGNTTDQYIRGFSIYNDAIHTATYTRNGYNLTADLVKPSYAIRNLNGLSVSDTTASTSDTTGAVVVAGGLGIAGNASVGGAINIFSPDNANKTVVSVADTTGLTTFTKATAGTTPDFTFTGDATTGIININSSLNSTSDTTGAMVISGGVGIAGNASIGGAISIFSPDNANKTVLSVADTTGLTTFTKATAGTTPDFTFTGDSTTGIVNVNCSLNSTSASTGSIVTAGGIGVAQDIHVGGTVQIHGSDPVILDNASGAFEATVTTSAKGYTFKPKSGEAATSGSLTVECSTESSSTTTGSIITSGGIGAAKRITATNMTCSTAPSASGDVARFDELPTTSSEVQYAKIGVGVAPHATNKIQTDGIISSTNTTDSDKTATTGSIITEGGIAAKKNIQCLETLECGAIRIVEDATNSYIQPGIAKTASAWNNIIFSGYSETTPVYTLGQSKMTVHSTDESSSTSTGSLVLYGGLGVAKRITATNMTCSTAPSVASDVVRLTDRDLILYQTTTYNGGWAANQPGDGFSDPYNYITTVDLAKIKVVFTCYPTSPFEVLTPAKSECEYEVAIPAVLCPTSTKSASMEYYTGGVGPYTGTLQVATTGVIKIISDGSHHFLGSIELDSGTTSITWGTI